MHLDGRKNNKLSILVDGTWSPWGDWSSCTITCGAPGTKTRSRGTCPYPEDVLVTCPSGPMEETESCPALDPCPSIDGLWSEWGQWGTCDVTCGDTGVVQRSRACDSPAPQNGGLDCIGESGQDNSCSDQIPCPGILD